MHRFSTGAGLVVDPRMSSWSTVVAISTFKSSSLLFHVLNPFSPELRTDASSSGGKASLCPGPLHGSLYGCVSIVVEPPN